MSDSRHKNEETFELTKNESTGIASICINNPSKRNAINGQMMEELALVITQLEEWKTVRLLIFVWHLRQTQLRIFL